MMIRAGFDNIDIVTAAQCYLNTVKTGPEKLENVRGTWSLWHTRHHRNRSDVAMSPDFVREVQKMVQRTLAREFGLWSRK